MSDVAFPPSNFLPLPDQQVLCSAFKGKSLSELPTPALVLDRSLIARNSQRMAEIAQAWQVDLRVHIKTHKTAEGVRHMLDPVQGPGRIIVSTLAEAWGVLSSGLVKDGVVEDILYGLPVAPNKLPELHALREQIQSQSPRHSQANLRLLVDHKDQIAALERFASQQQGTSTTHQPWSIMVKVENGGYRAGVRPDSEVFSDLLKLLSVSKHSRLFGFYCHAGQSYSSRGPDDASAFLTSEVEAVNKASEVAHSIFAPSALPERLVLSVGSTPTAHAASTAPSSETLKQLKASIKGDLELHAGNYPFLDLQQLATKALPGVTGSQDSSTMSDVAISVVCSVVSNYTGRGEGVSADDERKSRHSASACKGDEALIDGGGIAFSKDGGPWGGYGHVVYPSQLRGWQLGRPSQEHGIMTLRSGGRSQWQSQWTLNDGHDYPDPPRKPIVGEKVRIVPQHACMTCAAHPWFYIVDSDSDDRRETFEQKVVDVWVPWKGW